MTDDDLDIDLAVDLTRSVPFTIERADTDSDGFTFEGYAAVFDTPTTIDSWEGTFDEQIARGAFRKTLRERTPTLMFDHGSHPVVGQMPLGVITTAREDTVGLRVQARLTDNWMIQPVRDAIADRAITGMSFRFRVVKDDWTEPDRKGGLRLRTIREAVVYELGPVVNPAYAATTAFVRSLETVLPDLTASTPERAALPPALADGAAPPDSEPAPATRRHPTTHQRRARAWLTLGGIK